MKTTKDDLCELVSLTDKALANLPQAVLQQLSGQVTEIRKAVREKDSASILRLRAYGAATAVAALRCARELGRSEEGRQRRVCQLASSAYSQLTDFVIPLPGQKRVCERVQAKDPTALVEIEEGMEGLSQALGILLLDCPLLQPGDLVSYQVLKPLDVGLKTSHRALFHLICAIRRLIVAFEKSHANEALQALNDSSELARRAKAAIVPDPDCLISGQEPVPYLVAEHCHFVLSILKEAFGFSFVSVNIDRISNPLFVAWARASLIALEAESQLILSGPSELPLSSAKQLVLPEAPGAWTKLDSSIVGHTHRLPRPRPGGTPPKLSSIGTPGIDLYEKDKLEYRWKPADWGQHLR